LLGNQGMSTTGTVERNQMSNVSEAVDKFNKGYACSQAILCTFGESLGIDHTTALKVSAAFAGGMRVGGMCGAVTGAIMVIGLKYCSPQCDTIAGRKTAYECARRFYSEFLKHNPSLFCKDLLGVDLGTPAGQSSAESQGLFRTRCPGFVKDAAEILEKHF
jgi:C_GCAxxG_C_C family probable redox protein